MELIWTNKNSMKKSWTKRVEFMSKLIPYDAKSVIDYGCGAQELRKFISKKIKYTPVDIVKRTDDCMQCDFNKDKFPHITADVGFVSGCLEYIHECSRFVNLLCYANKTVILSYVTTDIEPNNRSVFSNHMDTNAVIALFALFGKVPTFINFFNSSTNQAIFVFNDKEHE